MTVNAAGVLKGSADAVVSRMLLPVHQVRDEETALRELRWRSTRCPARGRRRPGRQGWRRRCRLDRWRPPRRRRRSHRDGRSRVEHDLPAYQGRRRSAGGAAPRSARPTCCMSSAMQSLRLQERRCHAAGRRPKTIRPPRDRSPRGQCVRKWIRPRSRVAGGGRPSRCFERNVAGRPRCSGPLPHVGPERHDDA